MTRRVMRESGKCRAGRVAHRTGSILALGRGGKSSRVFGGEEGLACEHDADVVMPSDERAALVVVVD
jgi:hypothetical protein